MYFLSIYLHIYLSIFLHIFLLFNQSILYKYLSTPIYWIYLSYFCIHLLYTTIYLIAVFYLSMYLSIYLSVSLSSLSPALVECTWGSLGRSLVLVLGRLGVSGLLARPLAEPLGQLGCKQAHNQHQSLSLPLSFSLSFFLSLYIYLSIHKLSIGLSLSLPIHTHTYAHLHPIIQFTQEITEFFYQGVPRSRGESWPGQ